LDKYKDKKGKLSEEWSFPFFVAQGCRDEDAKELPAPRARAGKRNLPYSI